MVDTPTFSANPFGNFDQSQWSNPYSLFKGKALPWPSQYAGTPTDAMGRPIQSFQDAQAAHDAWAVANPAPAAGTTLNSTPTLKPGGIYGNAPAGGYGLTMGQPYSMSQLAQKMGVPDQGSTGANDAAAIMMMMGVTPTAQMGFNQPQQQAAAPAAPANPIDMSQAYLNALANPGKVTTPGATVPQGATAYQPGSGVLQQFLQNWQPAQSGPGAGFQQGFNRALRSS